MSTVKKNTNQPADWILKMREVAKDILSYNKKDRNMNHNQMMQKFYLIMTKHGIKQGEWTEGGGRLCNNPEWTMCLHLMRDSYAQNSLLADLFGDKMPASLQAYGTKPVAKKIVTAKKKK